MKVMEEKTNVSNVGELMMTLVENKSEDEAGATTPNNTTFKKITIAEKGITLTAVQEIHTTGKKTITTSHSQAESKHTTKKITDNMTLCLNLSD